MTDHDRDRSRSVGLAGFRRGYVVGVTAVVLVLCIAATAAVVVWFVVARKHPENAAGHHEPDRQGSARFFGHRTDRPGSPGAEADGVRRAGEPQPGPSAESLPPRDDRLT